MALSYHSPQVLTSVLPHHVGCRTTVSRARSGSGVPPAWAMVTSLASADGGLRQQTPPLVLLVDVEASAMPLVDVEPSAMPSQDVVFVYSRYHPRHGISDAISGCGISVPQMIHPRIPSAMASWIPLGMHTARAYALSVRMHLYYGDTPIHIDNAAHVM